MARTKFRVEVLTPEGQVFDDEVEMVSTRTEVGSIGVLANHQPLLGMLVPAELRLYKSESDVERFAQGEGYIQVSKNQVLVLAEESAREAEDGSEEQRRCQRDQRRWEAFLSIAEGGGR